MTRIEEWGNGMSFIRDLSEQGSYAVIGLAIGGDQDIAVDAVRDGLYRDAVTGQEARAQGGRIGFRVRGNSAGVYVLDGPGKVGEPGVWLR